MQITILSGGIQAIGDDNQPIPLQPSERHAIVVLATANHQTSAEELVAYGVRATTASVHTCMSTLSSKLGGRIKSDSLGYWLQVQPDDTFDHRDFTTLITTAAAAVNGDIWLADLIYEHALTAWQPPLLAGLPNKPGTAGLRTWLLRERLDAITGLAEVKRELGDHQAVITMLQDLVPAEPNLESLRGLLMWAYSQDNRAQDALDLYTQLEEHLRAKNGSKPGSELRRLRQRIIDEDPDLHIDPPPLHPNDQLVLATGGDLEADSPTRLADALIGGVLNTFRDRFRVVLFGLASKDGALLQEHNLQACQRVVQKCVREGIDQIIVIGAPPPHDRHSMHRAARRAALGAKILYTNDDPSVRALLHYDIGDDPGIAVLPGGLRDIHAILEHPELHDLLDLGRPVLWVIPTEVNYTLDSEGPEQLLKTLIDASAIGSHVMINVALAEGMTIDLAMKLAVIYVGVEPAVQLRDPQRAAAMLTGLQLREPGVVPIEKLWTNTWPIIKDFRAVGVVGEKVSDW